MDIAEEFEKYLKNFPIGTMFNSTQLQKNLSQIGEHSEKSYIPSDYCYNSYCINSQWDRNKILFFERNGHKYKYLGKNYPYNGPVKDKNGNIYGYWNNGVFIKEDKSVEANIKEYIQKYKNSFNERFQDEIYKWKAVKCFQDNCDLASNNFIEMYKSSIGQTHNLLNQGGIKRPIQMIIDYCNEGWEDEIKNAFKKLLDPKDDIGQKINEFLSKIEKINSDRNKANGNTNWSSYHDLNVVCTYLWLMYPNKYYIYKYSVVKKITEILNYDYIPIRKTDLKSNILNFKNNQNLYEDIRNTIIKDNELLALVKNSMDETCYKDNEYHLLAQDLGYFIYQNGSISNNVEGNDMNNKNTINNDSIPLNQILYGPPGTGKTYNTVIKAMEIINPSCIEYDEKGVVSNYSDVKNEFDKVRDNHQIEFITFHQSYSYEEFVEGIKPDLDTESWNEPVDKLTYKGSNGIFKTIANRALFERLNIQIGQQDAILDFKNLKEMFIEEYSVGSTFKTGTKNAEFRIDKYTKDSARITPTNGKYTYSITFKYLEEAYNKKMSSQGEIATINGVASGLSCYYFAIYEKLLKIKKSNDNNQVKSNMNEMSDEDKLQLVRDYYEGKIKLNNNKISKPYVLIIDEINRGNISKIFGELITLIEEDKRENMSVKLPYSQETFTVPKNLYIIGTMNTSDRSIASIDIALRRRFKFKEMMPNSDLVADFGIGFNTIFDDLNNKIKLLLDRDHQIGHSYFINTKYNNSNGNNNVETLKDIWFSEILPLLNEYFYCDWEKLKLIIPGFIKKLDVPEALKNECDDSIYEFKTFDEVTDFEKALNQEKFEQV